MSSSVACAHWRSSPVIDFQQSWQLPLGGNPYSVHPVATSTASHLCDCVKTCEKNPECRAISHSKTLSTCLIFDFGHPDSGPVAASRVVNVPGMTHPMQGEWSGPDWSRTTSAGSHPETIVSADACLTACLSGEFGACDFVVYGPGWSKNVESTTNTCWLRSATRDGDWVSGFWSGIDWTGVIGVPSPQSPQNTPIISTTPAVELPGSSTSVSLTGLSNSAGSAVPTSATSNFTSLGTVTTASPLSVGTSIIFPAPKDSATRSLPSSPASNSSSTGSDSSSTGPSRAIIATVVIVVLVILFAISVAIYYFIQRRRNPHDASYKTRRGDFIKDPLHYNTNGVFGILATPSQNPETFITIDDTNMYEAAPMPSNPNPTTSRPATNNYDEITLLRQQQDMILTKKSGTVPISMMQPAPPRYEEECASGAVPAAHTGPSKKIHNSKEKAPKRL